MKDKNLKQINDTYEQDRVKIFVDSDNDDLDKIAFKTKTVTRDKERHYRMSSDQFKKI